jgi:hypothetical protein
MLENGCDRQFLGLSLPVRGQKTDKRFAETKLLGEFNPTVWQPVAVLP